MEGFDTPVIFFGKPARLRLNIYNCSSTGTLRGCGSCNQFSIFNFYNCGGQCPSVADRHYS
eukprot:scaffold137278_cov21-Prasinocladus_malaysianus.AAC.1